MIIGSMNHPRKDIVEEIYEFADLGLEFIDLTLEPPTAASWLAEPKRICAALEKTGLGVIGHTAYYLPIDSPFEEVRVAAVTELKRCLRVFADVGSKWMNIHPGRYTPMHPRSFYIERNLLSLNELLEVGRQVGVGLMLENLPGDYNNSAQLGELLDPLPELGLHLDIGHANLLVQTNSTFDLMHRYGDRLKHVHLHDNKGGDADLHLPLGSGTLDVRGCLKAVKDTGYDATIALEVFTPDRHFLAYSAGVLRQIWSEI
jgi:sugar phosphate isomerase/epimerase